MTISEIHDWIGSDEHIGAPARVREVRAHSSVRTATRSGRQVTVSETLLWEIQMVKQFDVTSQAWQSIIFRVLDRETLQLMIAHSEDTRVELDPDRLAQAQSRARDIGEAAFARASIGDSPLMDFLEWFAGAENASPLLADHRADVEALFDSVHCGLFQRAQLLAERATSDVLYTRDNTSATLISPRQCLRYCVPHGTEYGEIMRRYDRVLVLHTCGKLKLLPDLSSLPAEAFSGPPLCPLETIRAVCDWVTSHTDRV
ncbi:MAG: hypothetical protein J7M39_11825 [Anaerolineae bacterium]|nr:hypothetical protein [Anaerolineae bacterium]